MFKKTNINDLFINKSRISGFDLYFKRSHLVETTANKSKPIRPKRLICQDYNDIKCKKRPDIG